MRTLKELKDHMNKYKNAMIIIGPEVLNSHIEQDIFRKYFNKKTLIRKPKDFYKTFKEEYKKINSSKLTESQKLIQYLNKTNLISSIFDLNIDGKLIKDNIIHLHGCINLFECPKCDILYSNQSVDFDDMTCEICGKPIRPRMILLEETYREEDFKKIVDNFNNTNTVITIGLDYKEEPIVNLIADYCDIKASSQEDKVLIGITTKVNPINEIDINKEIGFHDFYVTDEKCENALERLLKGLEII